MIMKKGAPSFEERPYQQPNKSMNMDVIDQHFGFPRGHQQQ